MIGNDIVDLATARAESNWRRKGFLEKLFTTKEQEQIANATDSEIKIWELWSRKEAVYKIYNRQTGVRLFMPLKIECISERTDQRYIFGKVRIFDNIYYTKTQSSAEFILTVAAIDAKSLLKIKAISFPNPDFELHTDTSQVPYLVDIKSMKAKPVSITHHGRFCSYITTAVDVDISNFLLHLENKT